MGSIGRAQERRLAPAVGCSCNAAQLSFYLSRWLPDESILIETIRQVASAKGKRKVGPHCMSILLPAPGASPVRVRYFPLTPDRAQIVNSSGVQEVSVAFSPWIICAW